MDGRTDGQTDERIDERTDEQKISPFYRTSSPIRAADYWNTVSGVKKKCVKRGKGTADHMMLLGIWLNIDRGKSG